MIIQIVLTCGLLLFLIYGLVQKNRSGLISGVIYAIGISGIYFVWQPDHATYIAERLGVGRGADLVLYSWIVIGLIVGINLHLKLKEAKKSITQLARHAALESVMLPEDQRSPAP
jgi:hypothetical protein